MLYKEKLVEQTEIIRSLIENLFQQAIKNQSHENEILLILINAHYDESLENSSSSPYRHGNDHTRIASKTFSNYMRWYTENEGFTKQKKAEIFPTSDLETLKISIQTEKSIYLRYWEADTTLFYLYQLTRLCNGIPFDWKWKQELSKYDSRQKFFREKIKEPIEKLDLNIFNFLTETVVNQIRNAIAHSQYCILNPNIIYLNYSVTKKYSSLKSIKIQEWEHIIHNTFVFRNELNIIMENLYFENKNHNFEIRIKEENTDIFFSIKL